MTLELHLPGKFTKATKPGSYREIRVRYRREVEWFGRLRYNPKTTETTVDQCSFGPHLWPLASDYYEERGIKYRSPSLIPKALPAPGDPKALLMDPSGVRYADYSKQPEGPYDFSEKTPKNEANITKSAKASIYLKNSKSEKRKKTTANSLTFVVFILNFTSNNKFLWNLISKKY
jgi:hypothetical protein